MEFFNSAVDVLKTLVVALGAGLGKGTQSLVISLCRYIVFIMLLAWVLCRQFGPVGVWNAFWATEVLSAIVSLIVYKKSV